MHSAPRFTQPDLRAVAHVLPDAQSRVDGRVRRAITGCAVPDVYVPANPVEFARQVQSAAAKNLNVNWAQRLRVLRRERLLRGYQTRLPQTSPRQNPRPLRLRRYPRPRIFDIHCPGR